MTLLWMLLGRELRLLLGGSNIRESRPGCPPEGWRRHRPLVGQKCAPLAEAATKPARHAAKAGL